VSSISAASVATASASDSTVGTRPLNMWSMPRLSVDTTGVPQASNSNTRRENMVGESDTELTFNATRYRR
jgi:hypothetical protein